MKVKRNTVRSSFILHPSSFILHLLLGRDAGRAEVDHDVVAGGDGDAPFLGSRLTVVIGDGGDGVVVALAGGELEDVVTGAADAGHFLPVEAHRGEAVEPAELD